MNIGIVGLGGISSVHVPGWKKIKDVNIVAVCDIREEKAMEAAEKTGARDYTDIDEMLAHEKLDIVDVSTPTYLHYEHCMKCLTKGIHVLCEKPVSLRTEDVDVLYNTAEQNNVKFMVAHVIRFWDEYLILKKLYDDKTYGNLLSGEFYRLSAVPTWSYQDWMRDESKSGLVTYDLHIHDLDFIIYAFGAPLETKQYRSKRKNDDYVRAVYTYDGFSLSACASWFDCDYPFKSGFRVQFERAVVEFENGIMTVYGMDRSKTVLNENSPDSAEDTGINIKPCNAYEKEIEYFYRCVKENRNVDRIKKDDLKEVLNILQ